MRSGSGGSPCPPDLAENLRGRVVAALTEVGAGVGCHYYVERRHDVSAALLERLGAAGWINKLPPACRTHNCPLCGDCEHEALFSTKESGRSYKKFRVTAVGLRVVQDPTALAECLTETYVAGTVLAELSSDSRSVVELNTVLLERAVAQIRTSSKAGSAAFGRAELRDALLLLEECGMIAREGAQYRRAAEP